MARVLAKYVTVGGVTYPPGPVSDDVAAQITATTVWADDAAQSESDDSGDAGYSKLKVADLKAEIADRNADREDEDKILITAQAKHADLVAALEADDAAQSEPGSGDGA